MKSFKGEKTRNNIDIDMRDIDLKKFPLFLFIASIYIYIYRAVINIKISEKSFHICDFCSMKEYRSACDQRSCGRL